MNKRSRKFTILVCCISLLTILVSACQQAPSQVESNEEGKKKVAVLLPGEIIDKSWNEAGHSGLMEAQETCNVQGAFTERVSQDEQLEVFRNYAQQGFTTVIGHGGEYYDAAQTVAAEYPDVQFVVSNGTKGEKNVASMAVSYPEMGYLSAVLACNMTKTNKIALVMAQPIPLVEAAEKAFKLGAERCGKNTEVKTVVIGSWDDVAKAREAALVLIDQGVDVLWHIADDAGTGVLSAAEDRGVFAIGLYLDQRAVAPKAVIASAIGSPATLIREIACGRITYGDVNYLSVKNGVHMEFTELVPDEVRQKVDEAAKDLESGAIKVNPW